MALPPNLDEDLAGILDDLGIADLQAARAKGREFWLEHFAELEGFQFDFDEVLLALGTTWEEAPQHPALQIDLWEVEIGVPTLSALQDEGIETHAQAFTRPRTFWRDRMARRTGLFDELEKALGGTIPA